ncbi:hypothetical protein [Methylomonas koyamae]|uniref:Uncharacterized protein n=1 Tax=Methylomonas koyamae TaxID=702114 RepID=A0AA91I3N4_9GAMM|nr:hypothetical protein [Methylomonas koyamae]OAI22328.1 hypothetical protein A1356_19315 [Methylomonas koyamae]
MARAFRFKIPNAVQSTGLAGIFDPFRKLVGTIIETGRFSFHVPATFMGFFQEALTPTISKELRGVVD